MNFLASSSLLKFDDEVSDSAPAPPSASNRASDFPSASQTLRNEGVLLDDDDESSFDSTKVRTWRWCTFQCKNFLSGNFEKSRRIGDYLKRTLWKRSSPTGFEPVTYATPYYKILEYFFLFTIMTSDWCYVIHLKCFWWKNTIDGLLSVHANCKIGCKRAKTC